MRAQRRSGDPLTLLQAADCAPIPIGSQASGKKYRQRKAAEFPRAPVALLVGLATHAGSPRCPCLQGWRPMQDHPGGLACRVGDPCRIAPVPLLAGLATHAESPRCPCLQGWRPMQERPGGLACRVGDPCRSAPAPQAGMIVILIENTPAWGSLRTATMATIEI